MVYLLETVVVAPGFAVELVEIVEFRHLGPVEWVAYQAEIAETEELVRFG